MGGYNDRVGSDGLSRSESTRNLITSLLVKLTGGISRRIWRPFIYRAFRLEHVSGNWILTQSRSRQHYCVVSNAYSSQDLAESFWPQARRVLRREVLPLLVIRETMIRATRDGTAWCPPRIYRMYFVMSLLVVHIWKLYETTLLWHTKHFGSQKLNNQILNTRFASTVWNS